MATKEQNKKWAEANKEYRKTYMKNWRDAHKEHLKEYDKAYGKNSQIKKRKNQQPKYATDEEYRKQHCASSNARIKTLRQDRSSWPKAAISVVRHRAKRKGLEFNIELTDLTVPKICPVLAIPIICGAPKNSANLPSVDRLDNSKGYIKGNVRVISFRANELKNDATLEELERVLAYMQGKP